ncbi:TIGR03086 family metal-binding protein [Kytococcus schroeteri]|uniref:TIGR03086 family metal-binding protein n=1 Tax=Kytococcus schroeteri TaxID=138300 RepID=UPI0035E9572B
MTTAPSTSRQAIDLLPESARAFAVVLERLPDDAWGRPTPCSEWSVKDVVNHVVAEHEWVPHLLRGEGVEQVGDRYDGDRLGGSPAAARRAWQMAMLGSLQAWAQVEEVDHPVALSGGMQTAGEYAHQMLVDLTVHAWDVAQGGGVSVPVLTDAVGVAFAYEKPRVAQGEAAGLFAPPRRPRSDHPMDQLVALLGR